MTAAPQYRVVCDAATTLSGTYKLSDNLEETPEGYLICKNVPVARSGVQYYNGSELGMAGAMANERIAVIRPEEEVFHPEAIASADGKPVTNNHPPSGTLVSLDNYRNLANGHAQNPRRVGNMLVLDLVVTDRNLIADIKAGPRSFTGKREISAGYVCEWTTCADGLKQSKIRINHIAVVKRGRAGRKIAIHDSHPEGTSQMTSVVDTAKALIAQAFDEAEEELKAEAEGDEKEVKDEAPAKSGWSLFGSKAKPRTDVADARVMAALDAITNKLDFLGSAVKDLQAARDADEDDDKEPLKDKMDDAYDDDEDENDKKPVNDAIRDAIRQLPKAMRQQATDALKPLMTKRPTADYSKITTHVKDSAPGEQSSFDPAKLGDAIMKQYNPHYQPPVKLFG